MGKSLNKSVLGEEMGCFKDFAQPNNGMFFALRTETIEVFMRQFLVLVPMLLLSCQKEELPQSPMSTQIPVRVVEYGKEQGNAHLEFSGTLQENRMVPIAFQVAGRVVSVNIQEGDTLNSGDLIAVLDTTSFHEAFVMAEAKRRQAQDAYDRLKPLHDAGSVTEVKWVEMETGLSQAIASSNLAKKNLDDAFLHAPVAGIVLRQQLEKGQSAIPGSPVLQLVESRFLDAVFAVPETEISLLRKGTKISITVPSVLDTIPAIITEVAIQADELSRTFPVRAKVDNRAGFLRFGMACHGTMSLPGTTAPALPMQSVLEKKDGSRYVYVVRNGKAYQQTVSINGFLGKGLRITNGLANNDLVVVEGMHGLSDGAVVRF